MKKFMIALLASVCVFSGAAFAAYPEGPITIVVPYAAGGAMDICGRLLMKYASKIIGQPIVVTDMPGGSGTVGAMDVLKSKSDGYKILMSDFGPGYVASKARKIPFDPTKDFLFCARQVTYPRLLAIRSDDERYHNAEEFLDYVKNHPGDVHVGNAGARTDSSVLVSLLNKVGGLELVNVPCSGTSEALTQLLGGHIEAASLSIGDCTAALADKKIILLAMADNERSRQNPEVPTFKELGIDVVVKTSRGYAFKAGTDATIVDYFDNVVKQVCEDPEYIAELKNIGLEVGYMNAKDYTEFAINNLKQLAETLGD